MRTFDISKPDEGILPVVRYKIDNLNKPKGSLGMLETLAEKICLIQQTTSPKLSHPCHLLFGADHGIEREGVSASPRDVTWQQMVNFANGGGGVNMLCRQHGFSLYITDVGVDHDFSDIQAIINRKIAKGTADFMYGPAMTDEQFERAINIGAEQVDVCYEDGCNIVCVGEMGIGNTSASSLWMSVLGNVPLDECIGIGSGLDDRGLLHKREVLQKSLHAYLAKKNRTNVLSFFGGFEMVAAVGAYLRAAEHKMIIMVDGFIMSACMLAAHRLYPDILHYAVFGHCGDEHGHRQLLDMMSAEPLLNLGMRLGEGTGALCSFPIIDSAVRMINEMNSFDKANITKYF